MLHNFCMLLSHASSSRCLHSVISYVFDFVSVYVSVCLHS